MNWLGFSKCIVSKFKGDGRLLKVHSVRMSIDLINTS